MVNLGVVVSWMSTTDIMTAVEESRRGKGRLSCGDRVYFIHCEMTGVHKPLIYIVEEEDPISCMKNEVKRGTSAEVALFLLDDLRKQRESAQAL